MKKKMLVYYGNKLETKYGIETVMESLLKGFGDNFKVKSATDRTSHFFKIIDFTKLFFKTLHCDIIVIDVFSTRAFWFSVYISFLCRIFHKRYILVLHGGNLPNRFIKSLPLFKGMLNNAMFATAPSMYLVSFFNSKGFNVKFIPNPIRLSEYKSSLSNVFLLTLNLLYLRGFGKVYRPALIIEACRILYSKGIVFHLHLFGRDLDGTLSEVKNLISKYKLNDFVTIYGSKPKYYWIDVAKKCQINLSVPEIDNTPVSVLECMALGIPTISTNVGGIPYLIEHLQNGILVEPSAEILSDMIIRLVEDKELYHQISNNGLNYVLQYDYSRVISMWNKLIKEC
jgi:glycosyltransferase involved in cell wall biosynthesis